MWNGGTTGKYYASLDFDGAGDYVDLSSHVSTLGLTSGTFAAWFKSNATDNRDTIIGFGQNDSTTEWGLIDIGPSTGNYDDESLSLVIRSGGSYPLAMYVRNGENAYHDNQWHGRSVEPKGAAP